MNRTAILIASSVGLVVAATILVIAIAGNGNSTSSALAEAEANFRATIRSDQVVHTVTEHYRREPSPQGPTPTDITIGPNSWIEESYTTLDSDGSVAQQVTFQRDADGEPQKIRSISDGDQIFYDSQGAVRNRVTLPAPVPFDVGASAIVEFVHRMFPSGVKEYAQDGITVLEGEIDNPQASGVPIPQEELQGLEPTKVVVRYEIDSKTGVLALFRETAIDAKGNQTVFSEDKVTTAEVIPAPTFFPVDKQ